MSDLLRDALRYRFLRDEDNWGEDSGKDSWEILGQSTGLSFDEIIDNRMMLNSEVTPEDG